MDSKLNQLIEEINREFPSTYHPHIPSSDSLPLHSKEMYTCSHRFYSSSEKFINHIAWILHPKSITNTCYKDHLLSALKNNLMLYTCTNCINIMLSKILIGEFFGLYSIWSRCPQTVEYILSQKQLAAYATIMNTQLYSSFFGHPKMYRLLVQACPLTKTAYYARELLVKSRSNKQNQSFIDESNEYAHNFDFVLDILFHTIQMLPSLTKVVEQHEIIVLYLANIYLSMKHWNKYHFLFFLQHYYAELRDLGYNIQNGQIQLSESLSVLIMKVLNCLLNEFFFVMRKRQNLLRGIGVWQSLKEYVRLNENGYGKYNIRKQNRTIMKKYIKGGVRCFWKSCKLNDNMNIILKVCKGCKMTYYCSKICQKKGWKYGHRNICSTLRKRYHL